MSGDRNSSKGMNALVAIIDPNLATLSTSFTLDQQQPNALSTAHNCECVQLPDPADASHQRTYLVTAEKSICELQSLAPAADYGSFFVNGSYVIGNGNIHTVSPVDPLFWFLAAQETTAAEEKQQQQKWQPLEQILADPALDRRIVEAVTDRTQLGHIFQTMQLPGAEDDEESYYKFSEPRTLEWLTNKRQRVEAVLWQQESDILQQQDQQQVSTETDPDSSGGGGGAFSSSFNLAADLQKEQKSQSHTVSDKDQRERELQQRCREESVQIVCTYLNSVWRERFLLHLKLEETVLMSPKKRRQQQQQAMEAQSGQGSSMPAVNAAVDWNDVNKPVEAKKAKVEPSVTMGAKKLAKVNTKGMQKMSSFFGARPAPKKAK